jgi:hypothetical protein
MIDRATAGELAPLVALLRASAQETEPRPHVPLPLALDPFELGFLEFFAEWLGREPERPPVEAIVLG